MARLENKIIKKLEEEGRISNISAKDAYRIYLNTAKRMKQYTIMLMKRMNASYILARELIYNS